MDIKTIAVLIDTSASRETRMDYATALARRHGAHLIGIFLLPPDIGGGPAASHIRGQAAIADFLHHQQAGKDEMIREARDTFEKRAARQDVPCEFRVHTPHGEDERRISALHADLVVAASPEDSWLDDGPPADVVQLATGVPFLLVPETWRNTEPPQRILIGWNASRESRRAIGDSLPFLALASSVTVLIVDPQASIPAGEEPGVEVAMFLLRHGVRLTVDPVQSHGRAIPDVILEYAVTNAHDMIVLGAYSHARAREIVLGGVTRSLLARSPIPLLISH
ncbi:universal stress protein [Xanthobacter dioxanivorans]|uniref:Universal stress protein n=1 Tax=Xanthobacter dioxanivorans TaxID=2528964 RepID=A0A974PPG6_9HYPH|nr:universal stress protein [Xanthobacter dioxanivorans]QRG07051.1 universal stress protein [Xanthobacter dioxanivorans]